MGIAEKRSVAEFRDKQFPAIQQEIARIVGHDIPFDINWDQIAFEGKSAHFPDLWGKLFFTPLTEAFKRIATDQMGREALRAAVKKITISNAKDAYSPWSAIQFESGVIAIDHCDSNVDDVELRTKHLVGLLESKL